MSNIAVFNNERAFLRKLLIFLVFSAIILLSFVSCEKTEAGKSAESEGTQNTAEECKIPFLVAELPLKTKRVSKETFATYGSNLTEIKIGKNVRDISDDAFVGLEKLKNISLDIENKYYTKTYCEGFDPFSMFVIYKNDFSQIFVFESGNGEIDFFDKTLNRIVLESGKEEIKLICGGAVMSAKISKEDGFGDMQPCWYLTSVCYDDARFDFNTPVQITGNLGTRMFASDGAFIFSVVYYNWADIYILKDGKTLYIPSTEGDETKRSLSICKRGDGHIGYRRIDEKYTAMQVDMITFTVTERDQYYSDEGLFVLKDDGEGGYGYELHPEVTYTLTDYTESRGLTLDEWCISKNPYGMESEYGSLEELMEANKKEKGE